MRIAFITFEYITESTFDGGLANYLQRVSIALIKDGHQVEIFTEATSDETIEHNGVIVHRIKPPNAIARWMSRITCNYYSREAMRVIPFALKIRRQVLRRHSKAPFDIVQSVNLLSLGLGLLRFSPIPVVVRVSSYQPFWRHHDRLFPYRFSRSTRLIDCIERYMVRQAAAVYAPSELIADAFRQRVRADIDVIRPPFLLDNVVPDATVYREHLAEFKYLLFFGTLKVLKGGIVLGDALKLVLPRFPDMHMVIVGKDMLIKDDLAEPKRTVMQYIFEQIGEQKDRVHYFERLHHEQLYPVIKEATGVVLPSRIDNLPNACLEAMAHGKVVIGTEGASFEELIKHGDSGMLVPKDNAGALADAMARVWQMSEDNRTRIGIAAKQRLREMEPDRACRVLEEYFVKCIKEHSIGS